MIFKVRQLKMKMNKRLPNDAYQTPDYTIDSLFSVLDIPPKITFLEPCKGEGNIFYRDELWNSYKEYCEIDHDKDYFNYKPSTAVDLIITNPPFSLAEEFLRKSILEARNVIYLLRINFLASKKRQQLWEDIGTPNKLLVLSARPSFTGEGTDSQEYAWFCWDKDGIVNRPEGISILPYLKY